MYHLNTKGKLLFGGHAMIMLQTLMTCQLEEAGTVENFWCSSRLSWKSVSFMSCFKKQLGWCTTPTQNQHHTSSWQKEIKWRAAAGTRKLHREEQNFPRAICISAFFSLCPFSPFPVGKTVSTTLAGEFDDKRETDVESWVAIFHYLIFLTFLMGTKKFQKSLRMYLIFD